MYKTQFAEKVIEGKKYKLYGVTDGNGFCLDFTPDERIAEEFADYLNKNEVEVCHVPEIIEDLFYSCMNKSDKLFSEMK